MGILLDSMGIDLDEEFEIALDHGVYQMRAASEGSGLPEGFHQLYLAVRNAGYIEAVVTEVPRKPGPMLAGDRVYLLLGLDDSIKAVVFSRENKCALLVKASPTVSDKWVLRMGVHQHPTPGRTPEQRAVTRCISRAAEIGLTAHRVDSRHLIVHAPVEPEELLQRLYADPCFGPRISSHTAPKLIAPVGADCFGEA